MIRAALATALLCVVGWAADAGGVPEPEPEPEPEPAPVTKTETATAAAPGPDPAARLPVGDDAAEHWDLLARFDSGHRLYARFLVTNTGPGDRSAVALGHLVAPDGSVTEFRNGRRQGRWTLSADRRRIAIGSSVLDLSGDTTRLEVDNDKRRVEIALALEPGGGGRSAPAAPGGYRIDLLHLAVPARGHFRVGDMTTAIPLVGRATLSHTWFPGPEAEGLWRRLDVSSLAPGPRLFLSVLDPPGSRGDRWHWIAGGAAGDPPVALQAPVALREGPAGDYRLPEGIKLGVSHHDPVHGEVRLGPTRLQIDPLDALPALLRMVYSFGGRPRHFWVDATLDVALKSPRRDAVLRIGGPASAALYFLDTSPPGRAAAAPDSIPPM